MAIGAKDKMTSRYTNEMLNPPEDLIALAGMFDVSWKYVEGYGARTWELMVVRPESLVSSLDDRDVMCRRTQSTLYDDWVKILDELIAFRDQNLGCPSDPTGMPK